MKNFVKTSCLLIIVFLMLISTVRLYSKTVSHPAVFYTSLETLQPPINNSNGHPFPALQLNTTGLNYEAEIMDIYIGNFPKVPWKRNNMIFGMLLNTYINTYAKNCDTYLPVDKEMLYNSECAEKRITRNGYGLVVYETCIRYRRVPSHLYVAPDMARAKEEIDAFQLLHIGDMLRVSSGLGTSAKLLGETKALVLDMSKLIQMNPCGSLALKRFQENLRRYALAMKPIEMEDRIKERKVNTDILSKNQNLNQLMEDLVYQNSRQWNFNRYIKGSIQDAQILEIDVRGRPARVKAIYDYSGISGSKKGTVTLTFTPEGLPDCLYFYDFPTTCRPANRKIAHNYAGDSYAVSEAQVGMSTNTKRDPHFKTKEQFIQKTSGTDKIGDIPFAVVENVPIFPGCDSLKRNSDRKTCFSENIVQFVNQNFNTEIPRDLGFLGINKIVVQFSIDDKGYINNIQSRAPHPLLDKEAIRVTKLLPRMTSGIQRGKPVGVNYSFPLFFMVTDDDNTQISLQNNETKPNFKPNEPSQEVETNNYSKAKMRQLFNLKKDNGGNGKF